MAVLAYAGDFAFGRHAAKEAAGAEAAPERAAVAVGAGIAAHAASGAATGAVTSGQTAPEEPATADAEPTVAVPSRWRAGGAPAGPWIRAALALTVIGLATQILGIVTRGTAGHRVPWGNM